MAPRLGIDAAGGGFGQLFDGLARSAISQPVT
jgi:hypothetical protein